jgi:hypothetical protein
MNGAAKAALEQLPLFGAAQAQEAAVLVEATPLHRRVDSSGSRRAARMLVASGRLTSHAQAVLAALERRPWHTSLELDGVEHEFLAELGVRDRTEAARRLPGLLKRGLVIRLDPDDNPSILVCRRAASKCYRWAVAGAEGARSWLADPHAVPVIDRGGEKALDTEAVA